MLKGLSFIGFDRAEPSGKTFCSNDRRTGTDLEPPFHSATTEDLEKAVSRADQAFGIYRHSTGVERGRFLDAIAELIDDAASEIIPRYVAETGLPEARAQGELSRTTTQLRMFAKLVAKGDWQDARLETAIPDRKPVPKPDLRSIKRPIGPVAVFGASNFPLAYSVAGGDSASALAAGCPIIVKAHPAHAGVCEIVADCVSDAAEVCDMPNGVFSLLFDEGFDIGQALVSHPLIQGVGFTGSQRGGLALAELASKRKQPIPVYAEMGSVNPCFLLPEKLKEDAESLAAMFAGSLTMGMGQFCTKPGLIVCIGDSSSFESLLAEKMRAAVQSPMLTAGIENAFCEGVERVASTRGVESLGASMFAVSGSEFIATPELSQEVFGPSGLIVRASDQKQAFAILEQLEGQLTMSFHGKPQEILEHRTLFAAAERKAGRILVNQVPTGLEVCDATVHGGPYPATTDGRTTSVGTWAIDRWTRLVCWQNAPQEILPLELRDGNPLGIRRMLDGEVGIH